MKVFTQIFVHSGLIKPFKINKSMKECIFLQMVKKVIVPFIILVVNVYQSIKKIKGCYFPHKICIVFYFKRKT